jgi:hypothetical protein
MIQLFALHITWTLLLRCLTAHNFDSRYHSKTLDPSSVACILFRIFYVNVIAWIEWLSMPRQFEDHAVEDCVDKGGDLEAIFPPNASLASRSM